MDRRETERLLQVIREARASREPCAIATVVRIRGSAYRREGARMIVRQNATYECALSGGCLEPAAAQTAVRVIATGEPLIVTYDLADDSIWGLGIGCSGAVDIRIERLPDDSSDPMTNEWLRILELGQAAVLVTPLTDISGRMIVRATGEVVGGLSDPGVVPDAVKHARKLLLAPYPQSGAEWIGGAELFYEIAATPPALFMFGAGYDAVPVAQLAWTLGFSVTVVDVREAFLTADRFPGATLVGTDFSRLADRLHLPAGSFVLVMNHHVERDQDSLRFALESDAAYVGVLGPRSRLDKLLTGLAKQGYVPASTKLARVRNPIGLSLGAETAEEVAVSILGEILAIRRGFEGGFLNGSVRSLHRPDDKRLLARS